MHTVFPLRSHRQLSRRYNINCKHIKTAFKTLRHCLHWKGFMVTARSSQVEVTLTQPWNSSSVNILAGFCRIYRHVCNLCCTFCSAVCMIFIEILCALQANHLIKQCAKQDTYGNFSSKNRPKNKDATVNFVKDLQLYPITNIINHLVRL